jgi:hypothetical protein
VALTRAGAFAQTEDYELGTYEPLFGSPLRH